MTRGPRRLLRRGRWRPPSPSARPSRWSAEHPLYILYTSGSTAKPKGILHTTGGYLTGVAATHRYVFDLKPEEDVYWCAADVGWVTGHSYIVYGPLANGATSVMCEGAPDYPHKGDLVGARRALQGDDPLHGADRDPRLHQVGGGASRPSTTSPRCACSGSVGEPINPKAWLWYHKVIGGERCPIVDTWWQTETGAIMITPLPGITATKPGSATTAVPGGRGRGGRRERRRAGRRRAGPAGPERALAVDAAHASTSEDDRFVETYFSRFGKETYLVGDAARRDEDGYFWVIGRIDDVVNVSGHRLSTAEVESAIVAHPKVAEAAVIGQSDEDTGQAICAFVTLERRHRGRATSWSTGSATTSPSGSANSPARSGSIWADDLPKTRSGKIMRRLLRDIAEGRALGDVTTLRDPDVMEELEAKIADAQRRRRRLRATSRRGALVDHPLDRDLERLQLLLDAAQLAQRQRLGASAARPPAPPRPRRFRGRGSAGRRRR